MRCTFHCLLVVLLGLTTICFALEWEWQNPKPSGLDYSSIMFADSSYGWAVAGNFGCVYRTTDGGENWWKSYVRSDTAVWDIWFHDRNTGWMLGGLLEDNPARGMLLRTLNGGDTWEAVALPPGVPPLCRIYFANPFDGWAVGLDGACLRTSDGGQQWSLSWIQSSPTLTAVDFLNATEGWIVGDLEEHGFIAHTIDGGLTWVRRDSAAWSRYWAVDALSPGTACAAGRRGSNDVETRTADGGLTWSSTSRMIRDGVYCMAFADSLHGFAAGYHALLRTTDGGITWPDCTATPYLLESIRFDDALHGHAAGTIGTLLITHDGGATWQSQRRGVTDPIVSVSFPDTMNGWAVATNDDESWPQYWSRILHTTDGGRNWEIQFLDTLCCYLGGIQFLTPQQGWAVGQGHALHTTDGGVSWRVDSLPFEYVGRGLSFVDSLYGWITGEDRTGENNPVRRTTDGGHTWQPLPVQQADGSVAVQFVDRNNGWVPTSQGRVLHTTDGGNSWAVQTTGAQGDLYGISFVDADTGWVVGNSGAVYRTFDGGDTWEPRPIPNFGDGLLGVAFSDADHGWVIVSQCDTYGTSDGGATWIRVPTEASYSLLDIEVRGPHAWIVGDAGNILTLQDSTIISGARVPRPPVPRDEIVAYPNPFNPATTLEFSLARAGLVTVAVFDVTGRQIETLCGEVRPAGPQTLRFDGSCYASGIYFARVQSQHSSRTTKLLLLK